MNKFIYIFFFMSITLNGTTQTVFNRSFGGIYKDVFNHVVEDSQENLIMCGYNYDNEEDDSPLYIVNVNKYGNTNWMTKYKKSIGSVLNKVWVSSFENTYYVGGEGRLLIQDANPILTKLSYDGKIVWDSIYRFQPGDQSWIQDMYYNHKENHLIMSSHGNGSAYLQATNLDGTRKWSKFIKHQNLSTGCEKMFWLEKTNQYFMYYRMQGQPVTLRTMLLDSAGNILIYKQPLADYFEAIIGTLLDDGNILLVYRKMDTPSFKRGYYAFKITPSGDVISSVRFGEQNTRSEIDYVNIDNVIQTNDKGFLFAGSYLTKTDSNYKIEWQMKHQKHIRLLSAIQTKDGGYAAAGYITQCDTCDWYDAFVLKTNAIGTIAFAKNIEGSENQITIFPNPASNIIHIKSPIEFKSCSVIDMNGKLIQKYHLNAEVNKIDVSNLLNGIYFMHLQSDNGQSKRMKFVKN